MTITAIFLAIACLVLLGMCYVLLRTLDRNAEHVNAQVAQINILSRRAKVLGRIVVLTVPDDLAMCALKGDFDEFADSKDPNTFVNQIDAAMRSN